MVDTNSEEVTFDRIDALARELFHRADATNVWSAVDEVVRLYFRKEAARQIQQRYTRSAAGL